MSRCRSCHAELLWALTEKGRRIPLDPEPYTGPVPSGLFVLRDREKLIPTAVAVPPSAFETEPLYRSHFATCPNAALHRRNR
jgi:hypothetical protein